MSTGTSQCPLCGAVYDDNNPCDCPLPTDTPKASSEREFWVWETPRVNNSIWYAKPYVPMEELGEVNVDWRPLRVIEYAAFARVSAERDANDGIREMWEMHKLTCEYNTNVLKSDLAEARAEIESLKGNNERWPYWRKRSGELLDDWNELRTLAGELVEALSECHDEIIPIQTKGSRGWDSHLRNAVNAAEKALERAKKVLGET